MQKNKAILILIAVNLINFLLYFLQGYGAPIIKSSLTCHALIFLDVGLGFFLLAKYAPSVCKASKLILAEQRERPLLGLSGVRRAYIGVCLFIIFELVAGQVNKFQEKITLRRYVENYIAPEKLQDLKAMPEEQKLLKYGKDILATTFNAASEEFFSRLLVLALLLAIMPPWAALLLSSFLFGVGHVPARLTDPNFEHWSYAVYKILPTAIVGFFYGLSFMRFGLFWSIAAHTSFNLLSDFLPIYPKLTTSMAIVFGVILVVGLPIMLFELGFQKLVKPLFVRYRRGRTNEGIQP